MSELWQQYRHQFPVTERWIYVHHAGVAPLCRPAALAMQQLAEDALQHGSVHYSDWLEAYQGVRQAAARLIGAAPGEIAIVKNTSEGIATVALGIDWRAGDKVVGFREEFPANYYCWQKLEALGVEVRWLSFADPLDRIEEAVRGARLLAISFVQYLSGYRAPLDRIGEICERHGCLFFVDAIQGLGIFPLDVHRCRIHALASDGHKWLLGPEGCGILYIRHDLQDSIEPSEFGWTNVACYNDYAARDLRLRPDAGRYECGTLNTVGCFGLRAALEFVLEVGVERIGPAVLKLTDRLAEGAASKGYEVMGPRTPETSSGIVSVRREGISSQMIVRGLKDKGIIAAPRQGWVRMSPHFYISPGEIERVVESLP